MLWWVPLEESYKQSFRNHRVLLRLALFTRPIINYILVTVVMLKGASFQILEELLVCKMMSEPCLPIHHPHHMVGQLHLLIVPIILSSHSAHQRLQLLHHPLYSRMHRPCQGIELLPPFWSMDFVEDHQAAGPITQLGVQCLHHLPPHGICVHDVLLMVEGVLPPNKVVIQILLDQALLPQVMVQAQHHSSLLSMEIILQQIPILIGFVQVVANHEFEEIPHIHMIILEEKPYVRMGHTFPHMLQYYCVGVVVLQHQIVKQCSGVPTCGVFLAQLPNFLLTSLHNVQRQCTQHGAEVDGLDGLQVACEWGCQLDVGGFKCRQQLTWLGWAEQMGDMKGRMGGLEQMVGKKCGSEFLSVLEMQEDAINREKFRPQLQQPVHSFIAGLAQNVLNLSHHLLITYTHGNNFQSSQQCCIVCISLTISPHHLAYSPNVILQALHFLHPHLKPRRLWGSLPTLHTIHTNMFYIQIIHHILYQMWMWLLFVWAGVAYAQQIVINSVTYTFLPEIPEDYSITQTIYPPSAQPPKAADYFVVKHWSEQSTQDTNDHHVSDEASGRKDDEESEDNLVYVGAAEEIVINQEGQSEEEARHQTIAVEFYEDKSIKFKAHKQYDLPNVQSYSIVNPVKAAPSPTFSTPPSSNLRNQPSKLSNDPLPSFNHNHINYPPGQSKDSLKVWLSYLLGLSLILIIFAFPDPHRNQGRLVSARDEDEENLH